MYVKLKMYCENNETNKVTENNVFNFVIFAMKLEFRIFLTIYIYSSFIYRETLLLSSIS